jgi:hypothetical protein
MHSKAGSAISAPTPRKKLRLGISPLIGIDLDSYSGGGSGGCALSPYQITPGQGEILPN